ncbi:hypothetical protein GRF29_185g160305 [Pseudopithomyces chartarum]|uniref:Uncharacterized protein n=1 Tax=Pseudopithomyces chartarum TaxID=1892770 RepID=A0AAN6LND9_9PLEO|nr:hypothetical protein GRF29_185g160305 [Pseudopithomyces chartarum]
MSHSPSHTLAATATLNASLTSDPRPQPSSLHRDAERQRRRSSVRLNLNLNDPGVPGPGEMVRRDRERGVSLGELHQEMEWEGEGRVNRLLTLIRAQQEELQSLALHTPGISSSAIDDTPSERPPASRQSSSTTHDFPARRPSSSFATSPDEHTTAGMTPRDESAYYQAETLNLTRENMMLRVRVRELG